MMDEITRDLRAGYTLDETLRRHNTNLKEVMRPFERDYPLNVKRCKHDEGMSFIIRQKNGNYRIVKELNRCKVSFGTYSELDDAKLVRDRLVSIGWDKSQLETILRDCGVVRNHRGGFHGK